MRKSWLIFPNRMRGGRQTKDCKPDPSVYNSAWESIFQMIVGLHVTSWKLGFLNLQISGEIRYPNAPIGYWKKVTIWKEACIVHVGAFIHDYQGEGASWSTIKCLWWKDCQDDLTSLNTEHVIFCTWIRPYQREASRPSGPGRGFFSSF